MGITTNLNQRNKCCGGGMGIDNNDIIILYDKNDLFGMQ